MSDTQQPAQIAFGSEADADHSHDFPGLNDVDFAEASPAHAPQEPERKPKQKGLPLWMIAMAAILGALVLSFFGLMAYKHFVKARQPMEESVPQQIPQPTVMEQPIQAPATPPVPVQNVGANPSLQGAQGGMAPAPLQPVPAGTQTAQQPAPVEPQTAPAPVKEAAVGALPSEPISAAAPTQPAPSTGSAAMSTQPDPQLQEWRRDREAIDRRLAKLEATLADLSQKMSKQAEEVKPAAAPSKPKTPAKAEPARKASATTESPGAVEHKRESSEQVVRGVPPTVAQARAARSHKKDGESSQLIERKDYYLSGWIGNRAFYAKAGREGKEDSVVPGDTIDGLKVLSIDSQNRRIVLEGNQFITTRNKAGSEQQ